MTSASESNEKAQKSEHDWSVWYLPATGEREATCSCGWTGNTYTSLGPAEAEARNHVTSANKCPAALNIAGKHYPCDWMEQMEPGSKDHQGWAHSNREAQAIWTSDPAVDGLPDPVLPPGGES